MSVGGDGVTPLTIFACHFTASHNILTKTPNTSEWGYALVQMTIWTWCETDQPLNYETDCSGRLDIQYDTPNGPWFFAAATNYKTFWGSRCKAWSAPDAYWVQRGQMLRDYLWHSLKYLPANQYHHGPHEHAQWYQTMIP